MTTVELELHANMLRCRFVSVRHEVCIPLYHFGAALTEQSREICLGIPLGGQIRGESMSQAVEAKAIPFFGDSLVELHFVDDIFEIVIHVEKNRSNATRKNKRGINRAELKPSVQSLFQIIKHVRISAMGVFGLFDEYKVVMKINVADFEFGNFTKAEATLDGNQAHKPCPRVSLFEFAKQNSRVWFSKESGALVIHCGHFELTERGGARPIFPFDCPVHDTAYHAHDMNHRLRGKTRIHFLNAKFFQVADGYFIEAAIMKLMPLEVGFVQIVVVIFSGFLLSDQPIRVVSLPGHAESRDVRLVLGNDALLDFFFKSFKSGVANFAGKFGGHIISVRSADRFTDALAGVGVVVVDGEGDNRLAFVLLVIEDTLVNSFVPGCFSLVFSGVNWSVGGHVASLVCATTVRPKALKSDHCATIRGNVEICRPSYNALVDKDKGHPYISRYKHKQRECNLGKVALYH